MTLELKKFDMRQITFKNDENQGPVIVLVITYVITGRIMKATVCACDFAHACPERVKENLNNKPPNIKIPNDVSSSIVISL